MPSPWREIAEPIVREIVTKYPDDCPERLFHDDQYKLTGE